MSFVQIVREAFRPRLFRCPGVEEDETEAVRCELTRRPFLNRAHLEDCYFLREGRPVAAVCLCGRWMLEPLA